MIENIRAYLSGSDSLITRVARFCWSISANCQASEVERISRKVPDYVTTQPLASVLILTNFAGASFDRDALRTMQQTAVFDNPYVKKSALIGTETLPHEFYQAMKSFSRRELPIFGNRDEALAWRVEQ